MLSHLHSLVCLGPNAPEKTPIESLVLVCKYVGTIRRSKGKIEFPAGKVLPITQDELVKSWEIIEDQGSSDP